VSFPRPALNAERLGHHVPVRHSFVPRGLVQRTIGRGVTSPPGISLVRVDREKRAEARTRRKNEALLPSLAVMRSHEMQGLSDMRADGLTVARFGRGEPVPRKLTPFLSRDSLVGISRRNLIGNQVNTCIV